MVLDLSNSDKKRLELIGERVQNLRKEKAKLSYKKFAEGINMNKNTYYRVESGGYDYNISNLLRIISYYDMTLEEFFEGL